VIARKQFNHEIIYHRLSVTVH